MHEPGVLQVEAKHLAGLWNQTPFATVRAMSCRETEEARAAMEAAQAEAARAKAECVATRQEADERQRRFMALNAGWKRKQEALSAATAAAESAAAAAKSAAAEATARADEASRVRALYSIGHP